MAASRDTENNSQINGLSQAPVQQTAQQEAKTPTDSKTPSGPIGDNNVIAWWDVDSTPIPDNVKAVNAVHLLSEHMKQYGNGKIKINAFTNRANINEDTEQELLNNGVRVVGLKTRFHVAGRSEIVDKMIIEEMAPGERKPGDVCIVITGDGGFERPMVNLCHARHEVYLIYPLQAPADFVKNPNWKSAIDWHGLLQTPIKPAAAVEPRSAICSHFSKNVCRLAASDCKFLHVCSSCGSTKHGAVRCPENPIPVPKCAHFAKGNCRWGKECQLEHECADCGKKGEYRCLDCAGKKRPQRRPLPVLPKHCLDSFFCQVGLACKFTHYPPELECFRNNGGKGVPKVRTDECKHGENCPRRSTCSFAHNKAEYVCFYCAARGDHLGKGCPKRPTDKEAYENDKATKPATKNGSKGAAKQPGTSHTSPQNRLPSVQQPAPQNTALVSTAPKSFQMEELRECQEQLEQCQQQVTTLLRSIEELTLEKKKNDDAMEVLKIEKDRAIRKLEQREKVSKAEMLKEKEKNSDQTKHLGEATRELEKLKKQIQEHELRKKQEETLPKDRNQEQVKTLQQSIELLTKEKNELCVTVKRLETEKVELTRECNKTLRGYVKQYEDEGVLLQKQLEKHKEEITKESKAEIAKEREKNAEQTKHLEAATSEIEKLRKQIQEYELAKKQDRNTVIDTKLDYLVEQNQSLLQMMSILTQGNARPNGGAPVDQKDPVQVSSPAASPVKLAVGTTGASASLQAAPNASASSASLSKKKLIGFIGATPFVPSSESPQPNTSNPQGLSRS